MKWKSGLKKYLSLVQVFIRLNLNLTYWEIPLLKEKLRILKDHPTRKIRPHWLIMLMNMKFRMSITNCKRILRIYIMFLIGTCGKPYFQGKFRIHGTSKELVNQNNLYEYSLPFKP